MKMNYKQLLIVIISIIGLIIIYKLPRLFINSNYKPQPEVKLRDIKDNKSLAIMVQIGDTYNEYTSEDNKWPDDNYIFSKAECVDNAGNRIEDAVTFNNETRQATLKSNKTIYCTLYFDESNIIKLRENEKLLNKNNLSPKPNQGGMYRYQGTDNVANWICFGTTDNCGTTEDLIDKYMYRIIGITPNGELYLLKETFLKEGTSISFIWNNKYETSGEYAYTCDNKMCPEWGQNNLFKRLNGEISNGNPIFIDSSEYKYMVKNGDWYNLIADHEWLHGDTITGTNDEMTYVGDKVYVIEAGKEEAAHYVGTDGSNEEQKYKWTQKVTAKISLMYVHDYVYSYYDGSIEESRGNPKNNNTAKNGWLFFQKDGYNISPSYEWLSTRFGIGSTDSGVVGARWVTYNGYVSYSYIGNAVGVRPVFYLKSKVKIGDGNGTKTNPFIITLPSNNK